MLILAALVAIALAALAGYFVGTRQQRAAPVSAPEASNNTAPLSLPPAGGSAPMNADLAAELEEKLREYLSVGVMAVLIVYPMERTIYVHESKSRVRAFNATDTLDVGNALPGFSVKIAELFAPLTRR